MSTTYDIWIQAEYVIAISIFKPFQLLLFSYMDSLHNNNFAWHSHMDSSSLSYPIIWCHFSLSWAIWHVQLYPFDILGNDCPPHGKQPPVVLLFSGMAWMANSNKKSEKRCAVYPTGIYIIKLLLKVLEFLLCFIYNL